MTLRKLQSEIRSPRTSFRLRLVIGALLFFLVYRLSLIPLRPFDIMTISWAADSAVFMILFLAGEWAALYYRRSSVVLFHSLFIVYFIITFAFCHFFMDAVWRQYSMLDMRPSGLLYFFTNVLPLSSLALLIAALAVLYGLSVYLQRVQVHFALAPLLLFLAITVTSLASHPLDSPILFMRNDLREAWNAETVAASSEVRPSSALNQWSGGDAFQSRYKKVVVFVMESITLRELKQAAPTFHERSQLRHALKQSHRYSNFFVSNMDSRTGMLAMLMARFVPYEAYSASDVKKYKPLATEPGLVDLLNRSGYRTAFAASVTEKEEVVYDLPWTDRFTLSEEEQSDRERKDFVCLTPYHFEHSCEDRILMDRLVDFIEKNDRAFLFQEFIYGHSVEYVDVMKQKPVDYYAAYIDEFIERLSASGLRDDTLVVVVSDHGIRLKGYEPWLSTYRLPLLFIHPDGRSREDSRVFSQIDFKDLLLSEASGVEVNLKQREYAPFIGMTGSSIVGAVTRDLDLILIKDRLWLSSVVKHTNGPDQDKVEYPPVTPLTPEEFLGEVYSYRECFPSKCTSSEASR